MNAIATLEPKRSLITDMAARYNMEPKAFADTLRATVVPKNATNEEFAAFLMVAREYSLNPITKEIYAFPKQGGGIQPIVSVDGWANLINSHPQCDGFEFEDVMNDKGDLLAVTCRIFRKDRTHPSAATEYMSECRRDTSTWKQWPRRMLRHKALIQAARYTFGFAGIVDPDEAERADGHYSASPGPRLTPPHAPSPRVAEVAQSVPANLPGEWAEYLARQLEELKSSADAGSHQGIHDAVTDAVSGARERGELSETEHDTILAAWEKMAA